MSIRKTKGFTFVELLVVIGIIGVLIGLLLPAMSRARDQSNAVKCASQLHQLFLAQTFYANDNGGRYTPVAFSGIDKTWHPLLAPYVTKSADVANFDRGSAIYQCPSADPTLYKSTASAYGLNSCIMLDNWKMRRDRKCNASEIILLGDKSMSTDDFLSSDDGQYLQYQSEDSKFWTRIIGHRSAGTYRHGNKALANMVMLDGHVTTFTRAELVIDSGHWYWGENTLPVYEGIGCNCP